MAIDPSKFHLVNVVDTCGVWNILSSRLLHATAVGAGCDFCITDTIRYECVDKERTSLTDGEKTLIERFLLARRRGHFPSHAVSIEDIQALSNIRGRLGKGELSAIAFALKIGQGVLTDDQKARRRATDSGCRHVQTTPHLLSWLLFSNRLGDTDIDTILKQHQEMEGTLTKYLKDAAIEARQCQLTLARTAASTNP